MLNKKSFSIFIVILLLLILGCEKEKSIRSEPVVQQESETIVEVQQQGISPQPTESTIEDKVSQVIEAKKNQAQDTDTTTKSTEQKPLTPKQPDYVYVQPVPVSVIHLIKEGFFRPIQHSVQGMVKIFKQTSNRKLILETFRVDNGPELKVYLSKHANPSHPREIGSDFYNVGALQDYFGSQTYDLPDNMDFSQYHSVVIY